jgi:hypothetical protein
LYFCFDILDANVAIGQSKEKIKIAALLEAKSYHLLLLVVGKILGVSEKKGLPNLGHCFSIFSLENFNHEFGLGILYDFLSCQTFLLFCRKSKTKMRYTACENDLSDDLWR